eukprot:s238_g11.t1
MLVEETANRFTNLHISPCTLCTSVHRQIACSLLLQRCRASSSVNVHCMPFYVGAYDLVLAISTTDNRSAIALFGFF